MPTALAPSPSPSPSSAADDERRMQEDDGGADADALDFSEAWNPARAFSPDAVPSPSAPTASPWTASFLSDAAAIPTAMAMPPCRTVEAIETAYNDRVAPTCFPPRATWLWTRQEHLAPAAETLEAESRHTRHTSAASAVDALYSISLPVPSPSSPSRSSPQMDAEAARPAATYHAWIDAQRKQSQRRLAQILGHLGHSC
ncbi:hypothetical protein CXG81DRAFT_24051 [Caulochytrium protostelioides]|uniref:Uncharacterized protein n=1 Tax=Caulochytrium protostelioides TaxID=1555241 RepID=A0A4P9XCT2_9FUNG|nr:hypothetical protein CXG81DRAFT_24051 [Caulochytrium protostelioides]|eukprot:RKP03277.1 hypothetical protein CXG81DRAFT_24051 [Caulochytrium protostelioides]